MLFVNLKYFNFFFFFNFIKNFNFLFFFNSFYNKKYFFYIKLKNIKFNNIKIVFNKNYIITVFKYFYSKNNFNLFDYNYNNNKNLINILYNFNLNGFKYLIFDNNKYFYNLYINLFSFRNLMIYKSYFFINPKYFTHKNFIYFYNQFLIENKIFILFIFDLKNILNFSHTLEQFNIALFTFNKDFDFFKNSYNVFSNMNILSKFFYVLLFNFIWVLSINYVNYKNKLTYLSNFNDFNLFSN